MPRPRTTPTSRRTPHARSLAAVAAALAALGACASATGGTPGGTAGTPGMIPLTSCYVADTAVSPVDTVHVMGPPIRDLPFALMDCDGSPMPATTPPPVVFDTLPAGTDLRDVLDRGLPGTDGRRPDVVVTRDPDVLAYAARRDDYTSRALPWSRTYALLAPSADSTAATPTAEERDALARDAVQADARGAEPPLPWTGDSSCITPATSVTPRGPAVLGYSAGDPIARQLAERVVALAASGQRPAWIAAALARASLRIRAVPSDSIDGALTAGTIAGAITAYYREPPLMCGELGPIPPGYAAIALVDSRAHVLVRRGSGAAFYIAHDGQLWFTRRPAP